MPALLLAALIAPVPMVSEAGANAASARVFLQSIYQYYRKGGTGVPMKRPELWFEPSLAKAIRADIAESNRTGDVGKLDADLFCDCQDFEDLKAVIGPVTVTGKRATATVTGDIGGARTYRYTLVATPAGWRVWDIGWDEGTVRELFLGAGRP
jgi:hypothetical protein